MLRMYYEAVFGMTADVDFRNHIVVEQHKL